MLHSMGSLGVRHDLMTKQQTAKGLAMYELKFDLQEYCSWFDVLSKPLQLSPYQQQSLFIICVFTGISLYSGDPANKISTSQQILKVGKQPLRTHS